MRFANKVAAITGGNSGIGLATAKHFKREGARVAIFGRNKQKLDEAAAEIGEGVLAFKGDIANLNDLESFFTAIKDEPGFGRVDHLVVNAGVCQIASIDEIDESHYDFQMDVNLKGSFFTIKKSLPLFPEHGGTIVIVSSIVIHRGWAGYSIYTATKAALRSFARTLSTDLLPKKIRINTVSPGGVDTPIITTMGIPPEEMEKSRQDFIQTVPLKRYGTPEDMSNAITFLSSQESSYIIGEEIIVDGGVVTL